VIISPKSEGLKPIKGERMEEKTTIVSRNEKEKKKLIPRRMYKNFR